MLKRNLTKPDKLCVIYIKYIYMVDDIIMNEYEKALYFLGVGCGCGCSPKLPKEEFAELREDFQELTKHEKDIFLMAQLQTMDGGVTNTSRRLKKKARVNKRTVYC